MKFQINVENDAPEIVKDIQEINGCIRRMYSLSKKIGKYDTDLTQINKPSDKSVPLIISLDIDTNKIDAIAAELSDLGDEMSLKLAEYQAAMHIQLNN